MMKFHWMGLLAAMLLAVTPALHAADEIPELKRIAGRFERRFQDAAGNNFRTLREVRGDQSIVTTYDGEGNILTAHTSAIKVERRGPVRVLVFFNSVVTAGPQQGAVLAGPQAYIYRLENDTFTEVWGLLEGDTSPPRMIVWQRVAEK